LYGVLKDGQRYVVGVIEVKDDEAEVDLSNGTILAKLLYSQLQLFADLQKKANQPEAYHEAYQKAVKDNTYKVMFGEDRE
jgi:hypothetical protein